MSRNYSIKKVVAPLPSKTNGAKATGGGKGTTAADKGSVRAEFARPEAEDDDGYDPYSDRPPTPEAAFQEDPWR